MSLSKSRKYKYTKYQTFTKKTLVKDYLRKYPDTPYTNIKTITFNTFNTKNSYGAQRFALLNRLNLNDFNKTDLCIFAYTDKRKTPLKLEKKLLEELEAEYPGCKFIDETALLD